MLFLRQIKPNIRRYLPSFLFSDRAAEAIAKASNSEHEALRLAVADTAKQFYVETATWGLSNWERVLGIPVINSDRFEIRRNRILLRLQSNQTSNVGFLCSLAKRYMEENADVSIEEHNEDYFFRIILMGAVIDFKGLCEGIALYKPAHLGTNIQLKRKTKIKYNVGLLNCSIGRKQIGILPPEKTVIQMNAGIAGMRAGKKTIGLSPPLVFQNKIFIGQYICRTGRIMIGGIR